MVAYPTYQNSGTHWLEIIPEHWEMHKIKYSFNERIEKGFPHEPLLAATQTKGVILKALYEKRTVVAQKDLELLKLVEVGDFVISLRSFQGGIEYAHHRGIISPAYTVMQLMSRISPEYFRYLAKSKVFISLLRTCVTGIREGQNINYEYLRNNYIPLPSLPEQQQIAGYLDWKTAKIKKLIKAKKKLIALLKEKKQNIINEAVTKGINPDVKMKDSGNDWIGRIPEHWEVRKIKRCVLQINEQTDICDQDEIYLALEHVEGWSGKINPPKDGVVFDSKVKKYKSNDILFGKLRPYLAKVALPSFRGVCVGEFLVLRTLRSIASPTFFSKLLCSKKVINLINSSTYGAKMPRADWQFIGSVYIGIPILSEQQEIVDYIQSESVILDKAISQAEKEIKLIQEYQNRLLSDVVTGKIDVRSVQIPDFKTIEADIDISENESTTEELVMENIEK